MDENIPFQSFIHFRKWLLLSQGKPSHGDVEGHVIVG
jgi:hypothetical protein